MSATVSTAALEILEMVKRLPPEDQTFIRRELAEPIPSPKPPMPMRWERTPDGGYYNPDGIPNDHPFFRILEEIEGERHRTPGPPPPDFD